MSVNLAASNASFDNGKKTRLQKERVILKSKHLAPQMISIIPHYRLLITNKTEGTAKFLFGIFVSFAFLDMSSL